MQPHNKYIKAIEKAIILKAPKIGIDQRERIASYIGTKHNVLGHSAPLQKSLARNQYGLREKPNELLAVFNTIFTSSDVFEIKNSALLFVDRHYKKFTPTQLMAEMLDWVNYVDNWAHSDYLSKFYSRFIEDENSRPKFLPHLKKWNSHPNKWKRRQSLVALLYYSRTKKGHLPFRSIIEFVDPLLSDPEYFVQKGVGWTLRETYNIYPDQTFKYLVKNHSKVSSVAFSAACEKMNNKQKTLLKNKRKSYRSKK